MCPNPDLPATPEEEEEQRFTLWMRQVDRRIVELTGFTSDDLPDYMYRDAFRAKRTPLSVAVAVVKAAKSSF